MKIGEPAGVGTEAGVEEFFEFVRGECSILVLVESLEEVGKELVARGTEFESQGWIPNTVNNTVNYSNRIYQLPKIS